ncbi:hypothetical protein SAMD00019534_008500 [Acytostelium subglobosum LB1]|uniref:hypothetical protein n=1 Tax=Acytostelium subglobosum LB1 TaxID=1410327 RepID=UPI000644DD50|nr:hypothetical protein SAMD00019534_008500 [Acytostelium subglobosum LB1]GAM17675.1 hypothetical protein SAMD00019534_008500 [Acytostelium subglobosum LB1]|eukprot:XP_012758271.1 hypothetical protein SAMD00019534_008500 [Acytostelium subglobosum LB1]
MIIRRLQSITLHHSLSSKYDNVDIKRTRYQRTLTLYNEHFGKEPDNNIIWDAQYLSGGQQVGRVEKKLQSKKQRVKKVEEPAVPAADPAPAPVQSSTDQITFAYCQRQGVKPTICFQYDGQLLQPDRTPLDYDMGNNAEIIVLKEIVGC